MMDNKTLTVFTATYNRKHTIVRTFESLCRQTSDDFDWLIIDDGSTDGTRDWIETLGQKEISRGPAFDWMGRLTDEESEDCFTMITQISDHRELRITYIYKPNGGLYSGHNVAYQHIRTELCVAVDSDDYMPDDAVERIVSKWKSINHEDYCGMIGLDFSIEDQKPIGGFFPQELSHVYLQHLMSNHIHRGDTKIVLRTDLARQFSPIEGYQGEKNLNPICVFLQVCDQLPLVVINENLCWVEYQNTGDSMSRAIWKQYANSPRSFAKMRLIEMSLMHTTNKERFRSAIHYGSSCILAKDKRWLANSPCKLFTFLAAPFAVVLTLVIIYKSKSR